MSFFRDIMLWIYSKEPAWFRDNSWANEGFAGLAGGVLFGLTIGPLWAFVVFTGISLLYEWRVDPNGFKMVDVAEREAAFFGTLVLLALFRLI